MINRIWTQDEINFLKSHYLIRTFAEIAKNLNRSYQSVSVKANRLGLYRQNIKNIKPLENITVSERVYLAAFIDGEGNIGARIPLRNGRPTCAVPIIEITNNNKEIIDWIASKVNCAKWKRKQPYRKIENRYRKFHWHYHLSLSGRLRVEPFLKAILPYLRIKKQLAYKVLKFYQHHSFRAYTIDDWRRILEIKELVNSHKLPHIRSRQRLAQFIKELESKEQNQ